MAVYLDPLRKWGWWIRGVEYPSCHMISESPEELHDIALRIGIKRKWFQKDGNTPHYDLIPSKRELAIAAGAIPLSRREYEEVLARIWAAIRAAVDAAEGDEAKKQARDHMFR